MAEQSTPGAATANMDVFLREADGSFKWIAATETLALAREKVIQNPASSDYAFLIVDLATGEKTIIEPRERPELSTQS
jgi:hypothetical protein